MKLSPNQSALILETNEHDEITVNVASGDHNGLTAKKYRKKYPVRITWLLTIHKSELSNGEG
jgi:hypothetical protein